MATNRKPKPKLGDPLDNREIQVLQGMARAMSNPEIGASLYLAEDTVKTYARKVFAKLGARNRVQAVTIGIRAGLVRCPCRKAVAS